MFFFCGSDICKDFPVAEDLSENPADTGIIITDLFIGKRQEVVLLLKFVDLLHLINQLPRMDLFV